MQPLEELLDRIKWDPAFGSGDFALAYYDRVANIETVVPLLSITLGSKPSGSFSFTDPDGVAHRVPLHRVRAVYKDGAVIWRRPRSARS
jgi:uncharacterized protein (UPF0248 family)